MLVALVFVNMLAPHVRPPCIKLSCSKLQSPCELISRCDAMTSLNGLVVLLLLPGILQAQQLRRNGPNSPSSPSQSKANDVADQESTCPVSMQIGGLHRVASSL